VTKVECAVPTQLIGVAEKDILFQLEVRRQMMGLAEEYTSPDVDL
jgi:hypothetical protein